ncbi:polygalacturonase inhibitor-like [Salvia miltiorrhiza]|uniref:polygalacturonase inhibitor-like n=1 Tax=Salvia miltiorrhiza TaxID=226208 RepID=UPI0025AC4B9A|nr:polygalacturonase inhibitor-like [Salvia miltiorrhiza]
MGLHFPLWWWQSCGGGKQLSQSCGGGASMFWLTIPSDLSRLKSLKYMLLSHNKLSRSIPPSLAQLSKLDELKLDRNKLTGSIPDSFWNAPVSFKSLDLSHNQLSGGINLKTQFPHGLENLYLSHNKISGALPEGLAKAKSLMYLDVSYNRLCGRIPTGGVLQKMDYSAYFHNKCLCGPPLPNCK